MVLILVAKLIPDLFKTNPQNPMINDTSSYLDLSPLYGFKDGDQSSVRAMKDGLLKPDTFFDWRLLGFQPGASVLLICFNRFHNYVVTELANINEGGRYTDVYKKLNSRMYATIRMRKSKRPRKLLIKKPLTNVITTSFKLEDCAFPFPLRI